MPTPLEVLFDPISIGIIVLFACLMIWEAIAPGRKLPPVRGWKLRTLTSFIVYFYLSSYLPLIWDKYLTNYQLMDLSDLGIFTSVLVSVLVYEFLIYVWHRTMHGTDWLWLSFHQMHHSAERIDTYGTFYYSPLDMIGFTMIGSLSLTVFAGLQPQAVTVFLFTTTFFVVFQHTNVKTPQWIGYVLQRPESHTVHHKKGVHAYNYSDLPVFDMIFGTFSNPKEFEADTGFYHGASARISDMLLFRDIHRE